MRARHLARLAAFVVIASAATARADEQGSTGEQARPAAVAALSVKAEAGPAFRSLYTTHFTGADTQLAIGAEFRHLAIYGTAGGLFGRTEYGLATRILQTGATLEGVLGRVRIGGGLQLGLLTIERVSATTDALSGIGAGGAFFVSVDVVRFGPHALVLTGKVSLDFYGHNLSLYGAAGLVGFRY